MLIEKSIHDHTRKECANARIRKTKDLASSEFGLKVNS